VWERREQCTGFWWEIPKERDHSEDQGVDGRMALAWILGFRTGAGCCECGDEPSGSCATELDVVGERSA
jgi:hypothetical protein